MSLQSKASMVNGSHHNFMSALGHNLEAERALP